MTVEAYNIWCTQCYDSDTEEGRWEMTTHAKYSHHHTPSAPQIGILDPTTASAAFISQYKHKTGLFLSNCSHTFEVGGLSYILFGASWQVNGHLIQRLRLYSLDGLERLLPELSNQPHLRQDYVWRYNQKFIGPVPIWRQRKTQIGSQVQILQGQRPTAGGLHGRLETAALP